MYLKHRRTTFSMLFQSPQRNVYLVNEHCLQRVVLNSLVQTMRCRWWRKRKNTQQ